MAAHPRRRAASESVCSTANACGPRPGAARADDGQMDGASAEGRPDPLADRALSIDLEDLLGLQESLVDSAARDGQAQGIFAQHGAKCRWCPGPSRGLRATPQRGHVPRHLGSGCTSVIVPRARAITNLDFRSAQEPEPSSSRRVREWKPPSRPWRWGCGCKRSGCGAGGGLDGGSGGSLGRPWAPRPAWLHIRVEEASKQSRCRSTCPCRVEVMLQAAPDKFVSEGRIHLGHHCKDISVTSSGAPGTS